MKVNYSSTYPYAELGEKEMVSIFVDYVKSLDNEQCKNVLYYMIAANSKYTAKELFGVFNAFVKGNGVDS